MCRVGDQVRPEHGCDRARGAHEWHGRSEVEGRLCRARDEPTADVEGEEPAVPESVLDVVPEDPQVDHVAQQVHDPGVHEHVREQAGDARDLPDPAAGHADLVRTEQPRRDQPPLEVGEERAASGQGREDGDHHVGRDQRSRHPGCPRRRVDVGNREAQCILLVSAGR